ncbi:MAG: hypothetical protein ACI8RD_002110, partial [Bacillariaceae sp.]
YDLMGDYTMKVIFFSSSLSLSLSLPPPPLVLVR